jgi:tetratricopeptide (TPR) repeat protein
MLAQWQGDHEAIRRMCEASLPVHRRLGNDRWVVYTLGVLATSKLATGDTDDAHALGREELDAARATGFRMGESYALSHVAIVLAAKGRLDEAEAALDAGVRLARKVGNVRSVGQWGMTLAGFALIRGDHARARDLFEQSLAVHQRLSDAMGTPLSLLGLTYLAIQAGENDAAKSLLAESLALDSETDAQPALANVLEMSARLASTQGHLERAVELVAGAARVRESGGLHMHEVWWKVWWPDPTPQLAELRSRIGNDRFERAWARGRALTGHEAIDAALAELATTA